MHQISGRHDQTDITKLLYYNLSFSVMGTIQYQRIHTKHYNTTCFYELTARMNATAVGISGVNAIGHGERTQCMIGRLIQKCSACHSSSSEQMSVILRAVIILDKILTLALSTLIAASCFPHPVSSTDKETTSPLSEDTKNIRVIGMLYGFCQILKYSFDDCNNQFIAPAVSGAVLLLLLIVIIPVVNLFVWKHKSHGTKVKQVHLNKPRGVALSKHGDICVCDCNGCSVQVFDGRGQWLRELRMNYQLKDPHGTDIDMNDNIYICDFGHDAVVKLSLTISSTHTPKPTVYCNDQPPLRYPYSLTVVNEIEHVFICYNFNREIIATDLQLSTCEHAAGGPDALPYPIGVTYYDGRLYVVDNRQKNQIAIFKRGEKEPVHEFNSTRDSAGNEYTFLRARAIHVANGHIYVVDDKTNMVLVMDMQYRLLAKLGEEELMHPTAIMVHKEHVYVTSDPKGDRSAAVVVYKVKLNEMTAVLKQVIR